MKVLSYFSAIVLAGLLLLFAYVAYGLWQEAEWSREGKLYDNFFDRAFQLDTIGTVGVPASTDRGWHVNDSFFDAAEQGLCVVDSGVEERDSRQFYSVEAIIPGIYPSDPRPEGTMTIIYPGPPIDFSPYFEETVAESLAGKQKYFDTAGRLVVKQDEAFSDFSREYDKYLRGRKFTFTSTDCGSYSITIATEIQ